jgi:hypothetical protein
LRKIEYLLLKYNISNLKQRDAHKVRGYFANKHVDNPLIHNHDKNGKFIYSYPLIQYKVIDGDVYIIGMEKGAPEIINNKLFMEKSITIIDQNIDQNIEINSVEITQKQVDFGVSDEVYSYKFKTPWMPLNSKNEVLYNKSDEIDREELLKKILIANLLSMSKGLNYTVDKQIKIKLDLKKIPLKYKNKNKIGFKGIFKTNFVIPKYAGIGRSPSRGFGTVEMAC